MWAGVGFFLFWGGVFCFFEVGGVLVLTLLWGQTAAGSQKTS